MAEKSAMKTVKSELPLPLNLKEGAEWQKQLFKLPLPLRILKSDQTDDWLYHSGELRLFIKYPGRVRVYGEQRIEQNTQKDATNNTAEQPS